MDAELDSETSWAILRQQIIEATGWTVEYVEDLDEQFIQEFIGYHNGLTEASKK